MDTEVAEEVCGVISEAASERSVTGITVGEAVGLCVFALALASDGGVQRAGTCERLRSRMCEAFVDALLEVRCPIPCLRQSCHMEDL